MDKKLKQRILVAALIAIAWISYSGIYHYRNGDFTFFGINLFAFAAWTAGLVVYAKVSDKLKGKNRFAKAIMIWVVGLIIVEYVGYHVLGIQLASCHEGLWGLDVLHVPTFAKLFYLVAGPLYIKILEYFKL